MTLTQLVDLGTGYLEVRGYQIRSQSWFKKEDVHAVRFDEYLAMKKGFWFCTCSLTSFANYATPRFEHGSAGCGTRKPFLRFAFPSAKVTGFNQLGQ